MRREHQPRGQEPGRPVTEGRASFKNPSRAPSSASTIALGHPQGRQESRALAGPCLGEPGSPPTARPAPHRLVCFQEAAAGRKGPCSGPLWPACLKVSACPSGEWGSGGSRARPARCPDPTQAGAQGPPVMHSPPLVRGKFPVFLSGCKHLRTGLLPHQLSPS